MQFKFKIPVKNILGQQNNTSIVHIKIRIRIRLNKYYTIIFVFIQFYQSLVLWS